MTGGSAGKLSDDHVRAPVILDLAGCADWLDRPRTQRPSWTPFGRTGSKSAPPPDRHGGRTMIFEIGKLYDLTVLLDNGGRTPQQTEVTGCRVKAVEGALVKFNQYGREMIFNVSSYAFVCAEPSDESNVFQGDALLGNLAGAEEE
jgi:hypothetical protein